MSWTDVLGVLACVVMVAVVRSAHVKPIEGAPPPMVSTGRIVFLLAMGITTAISTLVITYGPPFLRIPVGIVAVLLAPGYAVTVLRRFDNVIDELAMALTVGFAMLVLAGTAMASTGIWEPVGLVALSTVVTAPVLTWQAAYLFLLPAAASTLPAARD